MVVTTGLSALLVLSSVPAPALAEAADEIVSLEDRSSNDPVESSADEDQIIELEEEPDGSASDPNPDDLLITAQSDDDIASGTIGTCTWRVDAAGNLTIGPTNGTSGTFSTAATAP